MSIRYAMVASRNIVVDFQFPYEVNSWYSLDFVFLSQRVEFRFGFTWMRKYVCDP